MITENYYVNGIYEYFNYPFVRFSNTYIIFFDDIFVCLYSKMPIFILLHSELSHSFFPLNSFFVFIRFIYVFITIMHGMLKLKLLHVHKFRFINDISRSHKKNE